jgi:3D (Asp-Asp-Asp) domain-containing protein/predicted transcriptional regulator
MKIKHNSLKFFVLFYILIILLTSFPYIHPKQANAVTLEELADKISKLSSEEEKLLEEIVSLESQINQKAIEIAESQQKLDNFEVELNELHKRESEIEKNIKSLQEELEKNAVNSYKYGSDKIAMLIISAKDLNEVSRVIYLYRRMIKSNISLIQSLEDEKEMYEMIFRKSEDTREKIKNLNEELTNEKNKLEGYLAEKQNLLNQVKGERENFEGILADIKERINQIQSPQGATLVGEWDMVATAYYSGGGGLSGNSITAIGLRVKKGIVAVDPKVIPLGTKLYIPGYGEALAADTGGWVKGDRIDLAFDSLEECYRFGRRKVKVYLVQK